MGMSFEPTILASGRVRRSRSWVVAQLIAIISSWREFAGKNLSALLYGRAKTFN